MNIYPEVLSYYNNHNAQSALNAYEEAQELINEANLNIHLLRTINVLAVLHNLNEKNPKLTKDTNLLIYTTYEDNIRQLSVEYEFLNEQSLNTNSSYTYDEFNRLSSHLTDPSLIQCIQYVGKVGHTFKNNPLKINLYNGVEELKEALLNEDLIKELSIKSLEKTLTDELPTQQSKPKKNKI